MDVHDLMTTEVIALNEDDNLNLAQMEMSLARIRHLPVVRQGRLVGLVTHRDILGAMCSVIAGIDASEQHELLQMVSVSEIMQRDPMTIEPTCDAAAAAKILLESKFGCLPVVAEDGQLVGIVTEADFVELAVQILEAKRSPEEAEEGPEGNRDRFVSGTDDEDW